MKINICSLLLSLFFFNVCKSAELTIKILNIDENVGLIHFAVYDKPDFFPENEGKKIGFKKKVTDYLDVMYKPEPPEPNMDCCGIMHNFFYDKKKLK